MQHNYCHGTTQKRQRFFLGIYSDAFVFFSALIHCNAWRWKQGSDLSELSTDTFVSSSLHSHLRSLWDTSNYTNREKISFKRLHIYRMSTPIRYSLVTWQLLSTCTHSSHHPGTFLLPPRQDSEWDVPCSKCQHNWAP